jgi:hypothetical protein
VGDERERTGGMVWRGRSRKKKWMERNMWGRVGRKETTIMWGWVGVVVLYYYIIINNNNNNSNYFDLS